VNAGLGRASPLNYQTLAAPCQQCEQMREVGIALVSQTALFGPIRAISGFRKPQFSGILSREPRNRTAEVRGAPFLLWRIAGKTWCLIEWPPCYGIWPVLSDDRRKARRLRG
jgi:hypothetical protein